MPKFEEGVIVFDPQHNETFEYKHKRDRFVADRCRLATEEEKERHKEEQENDIKEHNSLK